MTKFEYSRKQARGSLTLGELERAAMDALWDSGEVSGSELFGLVGALTGIKHNTLLTVLERLTGKGLVVKVKRGKFNYYKPRLSKDKFCTEVAGPIVAELFEVASGPAISAFVECIEDRPKLLDELKRLIAVKEKSGEKTKGGED